MSVIENFQAGLAIDQGQIRETNEDSAVTLEIDRLDGRMVGIYAVADGMGGHRHGAIASRTAIHTAVRYLVDCLTKSNDDAYERWLHQAVTVANRVVFNLEEPSPSHMGTTLLIAIVDDHNAYLANVGDSRAYLISPREIYQITEAHNAAQELLRAGLITHEHAARHPLRHVLSRGVGLEATTDIDLYAVDIENSFLLLCTDGLTGEVDDDTIFRTVWRAYSPQDASDALVRAANESGGHDNIAVIVVHHGDDPSPFDTPTVSNRSQLTSPRSN